MFGSCFSVTIAGEAAESEDDEMKNVESVLVSNVEKEELPKEIDLQIFDWEQVLDEQANKSTLSELRAELSSSLVRQQQMGQSFAINLQMRTIWAAEPTTT